MEETEPRDHIEPPPIMLQKIRDPLKGKTFISTFVPGPPNVVLNE
jgi:hypothetical protein